MTLFEGRGVRQGQKKSPSQSAYYNLVGGLLVIVCVFVVGFFSGKLLGGESLDSSTPLYSIIGATSNKEVTDLDFDQFWQVWQTIMSQYVDNHVTSKDLYYGALKGLVSSVGDPVTIFLDPEETTQYNEGNEGKFEGIGAELGYENGMVIVISPLDGSPALTAGIRAGDQILAIDEEDVTNENIFQIVARIRGDAGTVVSLTVVHNGGTAPEKIDVIRGEITVPSISYDGTEDGVAVVDVDRFTEASVSAWQTRWDEVMDEVSADNPEAIILDLRGNPGGYFNAAVWAAGEFLPRGTLVTQQTDREGNLVDFAVNRDGRFLDIPLAVLVDAGSASASEILSGALQYHGRAEIIGQPTFGKGTAQQVIDYPDGSSLHITTLKWILPGGKTLDHEHVIEPDIGVEITEDDFKDGLDPQMDAALVYLSSNNI